MSDRLTLGQFYANVDTYWELEVHQRYGQALFNCLYIWRPDLSERIRSTSLDPFYTLQYPFGPAAEPIHGWLMEHWDDDLFNQPGDIHASSEGH